LTWCNILSLSKDIEITESLIRDLAGDIKDVTIFDFTDSLFLKEKRSLAILKKLLNEGPKPFL
jgi:DNA polymerase III delta subunit